MNPERILEFAVDNCEVSTTFRRKEGQVPVKGFDFAKYKNCARGGIISCEWTAQMILSFEIMADYYKRNDPDKSGAYLDKSLFYSNELQKCSSLPLLKRHRGSLSSLCFKRLR